MRLRLLRHHLPLCAASIATVAALYCTRPYRDVISRASFATAYPALALLAATLLVGPLNLLRRRPNPVSSDLRRDIGIWAGIVSLFHAVVGQCVHLRGRPWLYYIYGPTEHHHGILLRHDLFGAANYTGLFGTLLLIALLATSSDLSLRRLSAPRWKQLQRWNYAACAFVAVHAFAYQGVETQQMPFVVTAGACVAVALVVQFKGWMLRRSQMRAAPKA
jgi:methionine sulfoxide reductase heme-binding subunit